HRVAPRGGALYGLTVYQLGPDFRLRRLIEATEVLWDHERWQLVGARTREFGPDGVRETPREPEDFTLPETLADFQVVSVEPEEFSSALPPALAAWSANGLFGLIGSYLILGEE